MVQTHFFSKPFWERRPSQVTDIFGKTLNHQLEMILGISLTSDSQRDGVPTFKQLASRAWLI